MKTFPSLYFSCYFCKSFQLARSRLHSCKITTVKGMNYSYTSNNQNYHSHKYVVKACFSLYTLKFDVFTGSYNFSTQNIPITYLFNISNIEIKQEIYGQRYRLKVKCILERSGQRKYSTLKKS